MQQEISVGAITLPTSDSSTQYSSSNVTKDLEVCTLQWLHACNAEHVIAITY